MRSQTKSEQADIIRAFVGGCLTDFPRSSENATALMNARALLAGDTVGGPGSLVGIVDPAFDVPLNDGKGTIKTIRGIRELNIGEKDHDAPKDAAPADRWISTGFCLFMPDDYFYDSDYKGTIKGGAGAEDVPFDNRLKGKFIINNSVFYSRVKGPESRENLLESLETTGIRRDDFMRIGDVLTAEICKHGGSYVTITGRTALIKPGEDMLVNYNDFMYHYWIASNTIKELQDAKLDIRDFAGLMRHGVNDEYFHDEKAFPSGITTEAMANEIKIARTLIKPDMFPQSPEERAEYIADAKQYMTPDNPFN